MCLKNLTKFVKLYHNFNPLSLKSYYKLLSESNTFENNFGIENNSEKYLKEYCR